MPKQTNKQPPQPTLASFETNLLGTLLGFHQKTMALLRQSSLDEKKQSMVVDRIKTLLDDATEEMKRTKQLDLTEPLAAIYEEVKRLVDELSRLPDGGHDKKTKPKTRGLKGRKKCHERGGVK